METEKSLQEFIQKICQTGIVWALELNEEYASEYSNEYEDEEGNPAEMICFWSEEKFAQEAAVKNWKKYSTDAIQLNEFIENWCLGMSNDQVLVSSDINADKIGFESDPLELILEINKECLLQKINPKLENYSSLTTLADEINKILITEE